MCQVRKYVIVDFPPTAQQLEDAIQTSQSVLRKNQGSDKCILKYNTPKPASLSGIEDFTWNEIQAELEKAEWQ